ncbi:MAG: response regulator [Planctomycetota bacterium]|jgi:putative two-component system response regulator
MDTQKKIMIVDDEPDVLKVLEKRLTSNGYDVILAESGRRALHTALKEQPDLIILDIDMPDMDGGEVAARLKDDDATRHIPVMFLSCLVTQNEEESNVIGDSIFLAKPYSPERLLEEIGKLV